LKRTLPVQLTAFIATRGVLNTLIRMVYPFLPVFGRGLGVDLRLLSLGITIRSASGVFGPLLASIGDTRGRKVGMLFGVSLFVAGTGLMVVWPSYPAFVLAMVLGIMANFTFVPSMQAFLGDRVPYRRRALVLSLTELGWSLSFIIGVPLVGLLIDRHGWLAPFPWLSGLGVLALVGLALTLPRDRPSPATKSNVWANLRMVLNYRPALAGLQLCLGMAAANELVNLTFGTWLEGAFKAKITALAVASVVIGVSELTGEVLVGGLVDRIGKRRAVTIGLVVSGLVFLALPLIGQTLPGALVGLFFIYLTFEFTVVSSIPLLTEVMPQARATFMSLVIAAMALGRAGGALIVPLLFGAGSLGGTQTNLIPVVLAGAFLNLTAILSLQAVKIASSSEDIPSPV
jgi:predicted MFS family arabinose efflux permease